MLLLLTQIGFFWELHVFLQLRWIGLFGTNRDYFHLEKPTLQEVFFSKLTQFSQRNNMIDTLVLTQIVFILDIHVFLQLSWIVLFGTKWAFLWLGYSHWQEVFLSKTNAVLTGKECGRCSWFWHNGFLLREKCVSSTQLSRSIWKKQSLPPLWKI
jgi:hypothetical protein